jgi:hypothetical protein
MKCQQKMRIDLQRRKIFNEYIKLSGLLQTRIRNSTKKPNAVQQGILG